MHLSYCELRHFRGFSLAEALLAEVSFLLAVQANCIFCWALLSRMWAFPTPSTLGGTGLLSKLAEVASTLAAGKMLLCVFVRLLLHVVDHRPLISLIPMRKDELFMLLNACLLFERRCHTHL